MSDVAVSDLKGGHAPAQKVGGMRVVTKPRVSESEKPVEKPKEEGEEILPVENNWEKGVRKEFKPFSSEIIASQESVEEVEKEDKKKVVVSGAATGEEDAFPKEAVKSFHEKPQPTHEKTALNKPRIIQQPRK